MKRVLLIIGFVLLILLVLGFIAPKEYVIERSVAIEAPRAQVYNHIKSLEDLHSWVNPLFQDSLLRVNYKGTPGTVGSSAHWQLTGSSRQGKEEVVNVVPLNRMETTIRTLKPWESLSHVFYSLTGNDTSSQVLWRYEGHCPFPFNIRHLFINMDHIQGEIHDKCLLDLKKMAEKAYTKERLGLKIEKISVSSCGNSPQIVAISNPPEYDIFSKLDKQKGSSGFDKNNRAVNHRMFIFDEVGQDSIEIGFCPLAGSQNQSVDNQDVGVELVDAMIGVYTGDYDGLSAFRDEIKKYLHSEGLTILMPIEQEFVVNPIHETDTSKWITRIKYRIQ